MSYSRLRQQHPLHILLAFIFISLFNFSTCRDSFKYVSLPAEVKTFRVNYFENKAQYVNTQLSPQITEKLKQKIINTTRLRQTNDDNADYDISGYVSQYFTSTISITGSNSSGNRLTVGFHLIFINKLDEKKNFEADLLRTIDFPAEQSLSEVEQQRTTDIVSNIVDEIFNKIFSNW